MSLWELRHRRALAGVRSYCMFIGHARGGGSLLGALLDAHPNAVIADEVDALQGMRDGASRDRILARILRASSVQARWRRTPPGRGRRLPNHVPGQWQGRYKQLEAIGSSRAGLTTRALAADPGLLNAWRTMLGDVAVRFVHVVRNPYDAISAMIMRSGRSFEDATRQYASNCEAVASVRALLDDDGVALVRYELFVREPQEHLTRVLNLLGLQQDPAYLAAATAVVGAPTVDRGRLAWTERDMAAVDAVIGRHGFLAGYRFDDALP